MANGYPIAALAGKQSYMDLAICTDVSRRVLIAGTYNCHPLPVAAATSCLTKLADPAIDVYGHLERLARRLEEGQRRLFAHHRVTATISRIGSAHCVYFMDHEPANWWEILTEHDFEFDRRYRRELIDRGVYHFPVPTKQGSISFAHTEDDIDKTLEATDAALRSII
jgi:glutamate-1-semialdehyde 2,1-aminomutase